jgi:Holliday junction resolvase RusA-like endonuclease
MTKLIYNKKEPPKQKQLRQITLILKGEPMAKQSVRQGKAKTGKKIFYQPEKYALREQSYRIQIRNQLPKDFEMFTEWVQVTEFLVVHEAPKTITKHKKKLAWMQMGGLVNKFTKPDLIDNLNKLPFDSMSQKKLKSGVVQKGVYSDDCLVYHTKEASKHWGLDPRIEITLIGV